MKSESAGDPEAQRNVTFLRLTRLINHLVTGHDLDRETAAELVELKPAAADRQLRAISTITGMKALRIRGRRVYRFDPAAVDPASQATVIAACFGSSLWPLFDGTAYQHGMRQALKFVLRNAPRPGDYEHIDRKFIFVPRGGEMSLPNDTGILDEVVEAVLKHRWLSVNYQHFQGKPKPEVVMPLSIAIYDHQLYLLGRPRRATWVKPYRFSRIKSARAAGGSFNYPSRNEFDPAQVFAHSFGIFLSDEYPLEHLRLRLNPRWRTYAQTNRWHKTQRVTEKGKRLFVELDVRICPEVEAWILGLGEEAEVMEPGWLRDEIRGRAAKIAAMYAPRS